MKQEVKSKSTKKKKLFEWDRSRRIMYMKIKQVEYSCELAEDNTFVCIAEKEHINPRFNLAEPPDGRDL